MKKIFLIISMFFISSAFNVYADNKDNISLKEVERNLESWCSSLVEISKTYDDKGLSQATQLASKMIDKEYTFENEGILFKPTLAKKPNTFRSTTEGTLSYFVGGNNNLPEETCFALKHWTSCKVTNSLFKNIGDVAIVMGKVSFKNKKGEETVADKTWGFKKNKNGDLKLFLHHSSLEYN